MKAKVFEGTTAARELERFLNDNGDNISVVDVKLAAAGTSSSYAKYLIILLYTEN